MDISMLRTLVFSIDAIPKVKWSQNTPTIPVVMADNDIPRTRRVWHKTLLYASVNWIVYHRGSKASRQGRPSNCASLYKQLHEFYIVKNKHNYLLWSSKFSFSHKLLKLSIHRLNVWPKTRLYLLYSHKLPKCFENLDEILFQVSFVIIFIPSVMATTFCTLK